MARQRPSSDACPEEHDPTASGFEGEPWPREQAPQSRHCVCNLAQASSAAVFAELADSKWLAVKNVNIHPLMPMSGYRPFAAWVNNKAVAPGQFLRWPDAAGPAT